MIIEKNFEHPDDAGMIIKYITLQCRYAIAICRRRKTTSVKIAKFPRMSTFKSDSLPEVINYCRSYNKMQVCLTISDAHRLIDCDFQENFIRISCVNTHVNITIK